MLRMLKLLAICSLVVLVSSPFVAQAGTASVRFTRETPQQETGFLNRRIEIHGIVYRYQVFVPENYRRSDHKHWPILLFLHGRGERGSEGMWQTQIGLPQAIRDHPERWPFLIVMPQCPQNHYWTDPDMLAMAMATLDAETQEFRADRARTYLAGLSLGGYGVWELARLQPHRWAAVAIAAGGIFWSYAPQRWRQSSVLPAEYARVIGQTPIWLFHGSDDNIVPPRESELMYSAFKASGGHIRLWIYQGLRHDCWTRAFNEPELPRWLLSHRRDARQEPPAQAERLVIPPHPLAVHLTLSQLDSLAGDYHDEHGLISLSLFHRGEQLYQKNIHGEVVELAAESPSTLFYPNGGNLSRLYVLRDAQGRISGLTFRDDRHEEHWDRVRPAAGKD